MEARGYFLILVFASLIPASGQANQTPVFKNLPDQKLAPMAGLPTCFKAEVQHGDPGKEPAVFLIQGTANCYAPMHWHSANEIAMVASGTLQLQMKDGGPPMVLRSGGFAKLPPKHVHRGGCVTACTFFLYADGPFDIHYVDESGKEIPAAQALNPTGAAK